MSTTAKRFPWKIYGLALVVIVLLSALPLIGALIAEWLAQSNGCALNEGSTNPCIIMGADWGEALYTLFVLGWLMLATMPLGMVAIMVMIVVLIIHYLAWRNAQDRTEP